MPNLFHKPERWRERERESRDLVNVMPDAESKRMMLHIANSYEWLARRAEERARLSRFTSLTRVTGSSKTGRAGRARSNGTQVKRSTYAG